MRPGRQPGPHSVYLTWPLLDPTHQIGCTNLPMPVKRLTRAPFSYHGSMPLIPMTGGSPFEGLPLTLYGRVSKDQRAGRSVSQQITRGRRWSDKHGCVIVGEFSDNDKSASRYATKQREEWSRVEEQILSGQTRILWIYEISRGTRDLEVWARLARVCRENSIYIVLDDDVYDPTKPSHMRQLNHLMVDAVYESDKNADRIVRDAEEVAEEGRPWSKPGFGYRREYDPHTGALLRQVPDPEQAKVVLRIVEELESGKSPNSVAEELNRKSVPTPGGVVAGQVRTRSDGSTYRSRGWTHQSVVKLVTRHTMMGKRYYRGEIKPAGGWEPIIEPARWELLRSKLEPKQRGRQAAIVYLLSGLAVCDVCSGPMYGYKRTGSKSNPAYRCAGPYDGSLGGKAHVQRAVHILEEHVTHLLFDRFTDPDVIDSLTQAGQGSQVAVARERLLGLRRELDDLYAEVQLGQVSRRMAMADESRLKEEMKMLEPQTRPRAEDPILQSLVEGDPADLWEGWCFDQRREALRVAAKEIRVLKAPSSGRRRIAASDSVRVVWV